MNVEILAATEADLKDIASIHVQSWRETYVGLVPQTYLDGLSVSGRLAQWRDGYPAVARGEQGAFIARLDGKAAGFVSIGPARDDVYGAMGEIYAVYLPEAMWGRGIGHMLFQRAAKWLRAKGYRAAYLWVLDGNLRAIQSYQRWGGHADTNIVQHVEISGETIGEILVIFKNL